MLVFGIIILIAGVALLVISILLCLDFIKLLFDFGFTTILIEADVRNIGNNRVIEKCGFAFTHKEEKEHCSQLKPEPVMVNWYQLIK